MKPIYTYILIIALIVGGAAFFADEYLTLGFTTTGISKLDFTGHDTILNDDVWTVNFVQGGMAQSIYGSMAANSQTYDGDEKTTKGFSIDIDKSNQRCEYPIIIDEDTIPIYKVDYETFILTNYDGAVRKCSGSEYAGSEDNIIDIVCFYATSYHCLYKVPQSSKVATFNDDSLKFTTDFKVQIDDDTYTKTITTDQSLVKFSDVAYIKWLGNLNSGDNCPSPAETRRAILVDGEWVIISTENYDIYKEHYNTRVKYALRDGDILKVIEDNNNNADKAMEERTFRGMSNEVAYTTGNDLKDGKVRINLINFIQFPSYVAYISADDVRGIGVYQPVATPKVVSVDDIVFKTGETGYVSGVIKNIGDERGGFETRVECDSGISMTGSSYRSTLEAGQDEHVTIPVTGTAVADVSCELITRTMDKEDRMRFVASVSAVQICTPGQQVCLEGVAKTCRNDGTGWYDDGDDERCAPTLGEGSLFDKLMEKLFGEEFGLDDIIPAIVMVLIGFIVLYLVLLLIPIILPMLGKVLLGLILRK